MHKDHWLTCIVLLQNDILMWGGLAAKETRPQQVQKAWHLAAEFMPNFNISTVS